MEKKCFACDKKVKNSRYFAHTLDGQENVLVGFECAKNILICKGLEMGYQPPKGGPKLFFTMLDPCNCHNELQ